MCWNPWAFICALLRSLCGHGRRRKREQAGQPLLAPEASRSSAPDEVVPLTAMQHSDSDAPATPSSSDVDGFAGMGGSGGTVIVMRHGHRQDEQDPVWHRTAQRPWDPPLSKKGREQVGGRCGMRKAAGDAGGKGELCFQECWC